MCDETVSHAAGAYRCYPPLSSLASLPAFASSASSSSPSDPPEFSSFLDRLSAALPHPPESEPTAEHFPNYKLEALDSRSTFSSVQNQSSKLPPSASATRTQQQSLRCNACSKEFAYPSLLAEHARSHTGERPFKCSHSGCVKTYTTKNRLTVHQRSHTDERPFPCSIPGCGYSGRQSSDLKDHRLVHLTQEERQRIKAECLKCPGCRKVFRTDVGLQKHWQTNQKCFLHSGYH